MFSFVLFYVLGATISSILCGLLAVLALICFALVLGTAVWLYLPKINILLHGGTSVYSAHLQKLYAQHGVNSGGKWPTIHLVKDFISIAIASHTPRDTDDIMNNVLYGNVEEMLKGRKSINVDDILKPTEKGDRVSLVLVQGAPGIGKSTLAWELCRRWNDTAHLKQFSLVVLHRFREKDTQQITEVYDLFPHYDKNLQQLVADEVSSREGKGILFILDGFDEFPDNNRHDNFLIKLITHVVLPEAAVIVTSRPSAAAEFFAHEPPINKRIEILGFTQEQVREFASGAFSESESDLKNFLKYINPSENPAINSLMYIPLNAVIVVDIYKNNTERGLPIPRTLTQLYTQLCLTMLYRYLEPEYPKIVLSSIADLSKYGNHLSHFQNLSRLAFEEFVNEQVIFYSLPDSLIHFGLLDDEKDLHAGGGSISYNFLHLTLQEFLAAYYVSHTTIEMQAFQKYGHNERWRLIWRFVAGLTKLQYFKNITYNKVFADTGKSGVLVHTFFLLCLFEAELKYEFDFTSIARAKSVRFEQEVKFFATNHRYIIFIGYGYDMLEWRPNSLYSMSPIEKYVLGYCIVNSAPTVTWEISISSNFLDMFVWGLNSIKKHGKGVIHTLKLYGTGKSHLQNFPAGILEDITVLNLIQFESELKSLAHAVSSMKNLKSLSLLPAMDKNEQVKFILQQLLYNNISLTNLSIIGAGSILPSISSALRELVHGTVQNLYWSNHVCDAKHLLDLVFYSSLQTLTTSVSRCENGELFTSLAINTCLTNLTIVMVDIPPVSSLAIALQHNTALQYLTLTVRENILVENCGNLKPVLDALEFNKNLKELKINIACSGYASCYKDFPESQADIDSRIVFGPYYDFDDFKAVQRQKDQETNWWGYLLFSFFSFYLFAIIYINSSYSYNNYL